MRGEVSSEPVLAWEWLGGDEDWLDLGIGRRGEGSRQGANGEDLKWHGKKNSKATRRGSAALTFPASRSTDNLELARKVLRRLQSAFWKKVDEGMQRGPERNNEPRPPFETGVTIH